MPVPEVERLVASVEGDAEPFAQTSAVPLAGSTSNANGEVTPGASPGNHYDGTSFAESRRLVGGVRAHAGQLALGGSVPTAAQRALAYLDKHGVGAICWGDHVSSSEKVAIVNALRSILASGNAESKGIAVELVMSSIVIDVRPEAELGGVSGREGLRDGGALTSALATKGTISERQAMGYQYISIGREEMSNPIAIEGNLVHEGTHAKIEANVIHSISVGKPVDRTCVADEIAASKAAARYLLARGGAHAKYGTLVNHLDATSTRLAPESFFTNKASGIGGTIQSRLRLNGVSW